jgi:molybdopterin converting factor small subunit
VRIQVRLFAVARQLAGSDEVEIELPEGSDSEYANDAATIPGDSEVACIPPVSGG